MIGELSPNHLAGESTRLVGLAPSRYLALTLARRTHLWFKAGVHWTTHPASESTRLVDAGPFHGSPSSPPFSYPCSPFRTTVT